MSIYLLLYNIICQILLKNLSCAVSEFKSFFILRPCLDKVKLQDDVANDECVGKMSPLSNLYESLVCTGGQKLLVL